MIDMKATTILAVRLNGHTAMAGDGQVTMHDSVVKASARKVRKIFNDEILIGFAGATADAFTLFERFEEKLNQYNGDLMRSAVDLAKEWRTDRMLRRLEALLLVADKKKMLLITGNGDVLEPDEDALAIGSGGNFAFAAALAYIESSNLDAATIAQRSLAIASRICVYTNSNIIVEKL